MKTSSSIHYHFEPSRVSVTRARAAYLLRAARSRRARNLTTRGKGNYRVNDTGTSIYTRP